MSSPIISSSRRISLSQAKSSRAGHHHHQHHQQQRQQQIRNASYIPRPRRPYVFTQLVMLTDGSSYLHRTTSPQAMFRATKDVRNSPMWNPSSQKLMSVEDDDAGKLRSFRSRFGRGWDAEGTVSSEDTKGNDTAKQTEDESLLDLISSFQQQKDTTAKSKDAADENLDKIK